MPSKGFRKQVIMALQARDKTLRGLAKHLKVPIGSLSSMLSNGHLPEDKVEGFAKFTGIPRSVVQRELRIVGPYQKMRRLQVQIPRGSRGADMVPFLKKLMRLGMPSLTYAQLTHLWRVSLARPDEPLNTATARKELKELSKREK
ncbi:MAG TPA: hypothetical protein VEC57_15345 [Candidatus Limnocylindrales bacterium]|nr:hypothetical protein [Candidatus Limnocylindrales bacterium]